MTVSADTDKVKTIEMPLKDTVAACDMHEVEINIEHHPPEAFKLEPPAGISKSQEATAEVVMPVVSIAKPAPGADITNKEPATELQTPAEVSTKVVEGDVERQSEEKYSEDILDDGTTVRKRVKTTKHMRPVTTVVRQISGAEEQHTVHKLVGTEVDEHVTMLEPGVLCLAEDLLENETQVEECEEKASDETWVKRKVTTVFVKCKKTSATQRETDKLLDSSVPVSDQFVGNHQKVELDRKPEEDQSIESQSKPSIIPVNLTKLEPLSKDRTGITADDHKSNIEQKSSSDEQDTTRSGSPSLSVVRLTKLEPLSFERTNDSTASDQPGVERTSEKPDSSDLQRTPAQQVEQSQKPHVIQPTTEDMIVPVPNTRQLPSKPTCLPTTTAPFDDDLELEPAVEDMPIQVEQSVQQLAAAPSNIQPVVEQEITETLATVPGLYIYIFIYLMIH